VYDTDHLSKAHAITSTTTLNSNPSCLPLPPHNHNPYFLPVFTHRDHIGCHAEWHAAFPEASRVIHDADMVANDHGDTSGFEMVLSGPQTAWTLPGCVCAGKGRGGRGGLRWAVCG
jgi:hypothetical protein